MFDGEAIADKIVLMIDSRQKQDLRISTLEKTHLEVCIFYFDKLRMFVTRCSNLQKEGVVYSISL